MFGALRDPARTGGVGSPDVTETERRLADVVRFGKVVEADYAHPPRVRVGIGQEDDPEGYIVTGWLPMAGGRARGDTEWHPLEVGERVVVLSEGGELQTGLVLPAGFFTDEDPPPGDKPGLWRKRFANGAVVEYDRDTGAMLFDATEAGSLTLRAGGVSIVLADGKITLNGPVEASDTVEAATDVVGGGKSLKSHTHPTPSGQSGAPS